MPKCPSFIRVSLRSVSRRIGSWKGNFGFHVDVVAVRQPTDASGGLDPSDWLVIKKAAVRKCVALLHAGALRRRPSADGRLHGSSHANCAKMSKFQGSDPPTRLFRVCSWTRNLGLRRKDVVALVPRESSDWFGADKTRRPSEKGGYTAHFMSNVYPWQLRRNA